MIKLDLKDYCQNNCPNFEPKIKRSKEQICYGSYRYCTTISCEHAAMCESVRAYLGKEKK